MKTTFLLMLATLAVPAFAGTTVLGGDATMTVATGANLAQNTDAYAQFVSSGGASAVLDWSKFNIGAGKEMNFSGAGTTFFNLVDAAASKSQIDGIISGNGSVWVINPNGIAFGASSQVNVGGLFAAAAGNLSNADDLRNGTATMPEFSSFGGEVSTAANSTFSADQVALMGKMVSSAGDFTGVKSLTINASSGTMTVDDVGGGKVSVNFGDFADADAEVSLGDLDVGGSLSVKSAGTIVSVPSQASSGSGKPALLGTTKTGSLVLAGDIDMTAYDDLEVDGNLQSTAGNVSLLTYGDLDINSDVDAYGSVSAMALGSVDISADVTAETSGVMVWSGDGDVTVDGSISAMNPDYGYAYVNAAQLEGSAGNIVVNGTVQSGIETLLGAGYDYNGSLTGGKGGVTVNASGTVLGEYGSTYVWAAGGAGKGVDIGGEVCGYRVGIGSRDESGIVAQDGAKISAGWFYGGDMIFPGMLSVDAKNGDVGLSKAVITTGTAMFKASGAVDATGDANVFADRVGAEGSSVSISTPGGLVLGDVSATGNIDLDAGGDVSIAQGFTIQGTGADSEVSIASGNGGVSIGGDVLSLGESGSVSITSAGNESGNGDIAISGGVLANGNVFVGAGYTPEGVRSGGKGGITLEKTGGVISSDDVVYLYAAGGNGKGLDVNGYVNGAGGVALASRDSSGIYSSKASATVVAGVVNESGDDILVASPLLVQAFNGDANLDKMAIAAGDASIYAAGDVDAMNNNDFKGSVSVVGRSVDLIDNSDLSLGDVAANDGVSVYAYGKLTVNEGATISVSGDGAELGLTSVYDDVVVDGTLITEGQSAQIAVNSALLEGGTGDVRVNGDIYALGKNSRVDLTAGSDVTVGNVIVDGTVFAAEKVFLQAGLPGGGVTIGKDGVVGATGERVGVRIASGFSSGTADSDIDIRGTVFAESDNAVITVGTGGKEGGSGNVNISGNILAKGKEADVWIETGNSDNAVGNVSISGTVRGEGEGVLVTVRTGLGEGTKGRLTVEEGGEVSASGKNAIIVLRSAAGNNAQGDLTVDGLVALSGDGGALSIGSAHGDNAQGETTVGGRIVATGDKTRVEVGSGLGTGSKGSVRFSGDVVSTGKDATILVWTGSGDAAVGSIDVSGSVNAVGDNADVEMAASLGKSAKGTVNITGTIAANGRNGHARAYAGYGDDASGNVNVSGTISASGDESETLLVVGYGSDAHGTVNVNGTVSASGNGGNATIIGGFGSGASGSVSLGGKMMASKDAQIRVSGGNVTMNGSMTAGNAASVVASGDGSLVFGDTGVITAGSTANVLVDGNVTQSGNAIGVNDGAAGVQDVSAAITADAINLSVGGSIGGDGYLGVDGKVRAVVGGDARLAAANGTDFQGGDSSGAPSSVNVSGFEQTVSSIDKEGKVREDTVSVGGIEANFSALGDTSAIIAGGDLSIYTAGKMEANGLLKAGGDITVSASDFGDVSYLQASGTLTINNVGNPAHPKIAYFESVNGLEPKINNQPNDTVIFIDGRLAGGNLKILNQFGANEAFLVETPELKSIQGIFGSPTFLHSDLDVANPMEVGMIDYLLQETPRLTLDKDFPKEADQHVDSVVIPERDSIQFGRGTAKAESVPPSMPDGRVVMVR